jgi:uncharacterized membrane protein
VGAFVYSLASIILFQTGLYPDESALVIMAVTVVVVITVVGALMRWIEHLSTLGSMDDSLKCVHERGKQALAHHAKAPLMGGRALAGAVMPETVYPVRALQSGYVQFVDMPGLHEALGDTGAIYLLCRPGAFALKGMAIAQVAGMAAARADRLAACVLIGQTRSYEQDPEFGLMVLSQISARALSPGINDGGTAVEAINRMTTLLWDYARAVEPVELRFGNIYMPAIEADDLIRAAFAPSARDGAGSAELVCALRAALLRLGYAPDDAMAQAALDMDALALGYGQQSLTLEADKARLRAVLAPPGAAL